MNGKESITPLLCPSSDEFATAVKNANPAIDVARFIDIARERVLKYSGLAEREPGDDATDAERRTYQSLVDFMVSLDFEHTKDDLLEEYEKRNRNGYVSKRELHEQRMLDMERQCAAFMDMDDIEEPPEIDRPCSAGKMTRLEEAILASDNVEPVRKLIEEENASPVARSGDLTPLDLALQLGRKGIAAYLEEVI
jgi:hypothetical protein